MVKETYPMLKECKDINFIGKHGSTISWQERQRCCRGEVFVGNVILKLYEVSAQP
ncbi:MAG: hypothetical protein ACLU3U_12765 [Gallintestinimicrobium sp.]